jgi:uncharacterized protein YjbJ (UPF0337 family)
MNSDVFAGKWKQIRGSAKQRWGELTDDDLKKVEGRLDRFVGIIQERYGYSRERAQAEVDQFLERFNDVLPKSETSVTDTVQETVSETSVRVRESAGELPAKARQSVAENRQALFAGLVTALAIASLVLVFLVRGNLANDV